MTAEKTFMDIILDPTAWKQDPMPSVERRSEYAFFLCVYLHLLIHILRAAFTLPLTLNKPGRPSPSAAKQLS